MTSPHIRLHADDVIEDHRLAATDVDLFSHAEIAARVAELVAITDTPLHVAVFGAWGTGKSSFLTLTEKRLHELAAARRQTGVSTRGSTW